MGLAPLENGAWLLGATRRWRWFQADQGCRYSSQGLRPDLVKQLVRIEGRVDFVPDAVTEMASG